MTDTSELREELLSDPAFRESFEAHREKRSVSLALRAMRKWAGLTQNEVAALSGLSQSHISRIEAATGPMPQTETLQRYAAACKARIRIEFQPEERPPENMETDDPIAVAVL